jgi:hypothetical protein
MSSAVIRPLTRSALVAAVTVTSALLGPTAGRAAAHSSPTKSDVRSRTDPRHFDSIYRVFEHASC